MILQLTNRFRHPASRFSHQVNLLQQVKHRSNNYFVRSFASSTDTEKYDYVIVGMGYAGAVMTARLAERCAKYYPDKKILAIEAGGPIQASTGGGKQENSTISMVAEKFQNASPDTPCDLNMPDVPGMYNEVAFRPLSDPFELKTDPGQKIQIKEQEGEKEQEIDIPQKKLFQCFQGAGFGGNGVYNGALYQEPADWWWDEDGILTDILVTDDLKKQGITKASQVMKPYFDRVKEVLKDAIHSHPSRDKKHYNHGLYDLVKPHLEEHGFQEVDPDTPDLNGAGERFFTVPTVTTKDGVRSGPPAWLELFLDENGKVRPAFQNNLHVMTYTKVDKVLMDEATKTAIGVKCKPSGIAQGGLQLSNPPAEQDISLKEGGQVIMCANTLPTCRLLYRSGIGCEDLRKTVMPGEQKSFLVNNQAIGTMVQEHVTTSLAMKYVGNKSEYRKQPNAVHFNPGDYVGNKKYLKSYVEDRTGPYTQFGPVVASHFIADISHSPSANTKTPPKHVTTELFYNPFGIGPYPPRSKPELNPYNGPDTFSIYVMLLEPKQRGLFRLKDDNDVAEYMEIYLRDQKSSWETDEVTATMKRLGLPDYTKAGQEDVDTMTCSVMDVLKFTANVKDIQVLMGPGSSLKANDPGNQYKVVIGPNNEFKTFSQLDATNYNDVKSFVTIWDNYFIVDGTRLPITRLQENHYNCSAPLARNLTPFGEELGPDQKNSYGVDPDTLQVRGTNGLCVADSSIFPKVIYCHPIGATMAMAEWAADKICPEPPKQQSG